MAQYYPEDQSLEAINKFKNTCRSPEDQKKFLIRQFRIDTRQLKAPIRGPQWTTFDYAITPDSTNKLNGSFVGSFVQNRFKVEFNWKNYETLLHCNTLAFVPKDADGKSSTITGTITETFLLSPEIAAKNPDADPVPRISEFKFVNSVLVEGDWLSFIDVYPGFPFYRQ